MKVTLNTIAKQLDVSTVTVFKALNDKKGVSAELRRKIKECAEKLGYIKKTSSSVIENKHFLYIIQHDYFLMPSEQYYTSIFYFLNSECIKNNDTLQILFVNNNRNEADKDFENISKTVISMQINGLFVAGEIGSNLLKRLFELNLPVVLIDNYCTDFPVNCLYVDNYLQSYTLTKFLIQNGHKNIGFVGDITTTSAIADRYYGFLKALQEFSLPFNGNWHINHNLESTDISKVFFPKNLPTAFVCSCDACAQRLYAYLSLNGLNVPNNISVVSFDNTPICDFLLPTLTSSGPQKDVYAQKAFEIMMASMQNYTNVFVEQISTTLVKRNSVKVLK